MSQHHTEDLQPFSFDDEAEDGEDFDGASQGEALEDYDVMNEETFGGADVGADADFSALSERVRINFKIYLFFVFRQKCLNLEMKKRR